MLRQTPRYDLKFPGTTTLIKCNTPPLGATWAAIQGVDYATRLVGKQKLKLQATSTLYFLPL
jgi:hypothetical protein